MYLPIINAWENNDVWVKLNAFWAKSNMIVFETFVEILIKYMCVKSLFVSISLWHYIWTVAHQAPLSMGFSRQEYWSGLPRPPPGDLPNPGIEPISLASPASLPLAPPGKSRTHYLPFSFEIMSHIIVKV